MGQTLREFEEKVQPRIPDQVAQEFKRFVRRKFGALSADAIDVMSLAPDTEINPAAQAQRDSLFPDQAPPRIEKETG